MFIFGWWALRFQGSGPAPGLEDIRVQVLGGWGWGLLFWGVGFQVFGFLDLTVQALWLPVFGVESWGDVWELEFRFVLRFLGCEVGAWDFGFGRLKALERSGPSE